MDKEHIILEARVLQGQGKTQVEIAEILGVCERTVRNHLATMPLARKKPERGSRLDSYKGKINEILEGNAFYNGELIYERLVKLGYSGKISVMKDYVAAVRRKLSIQAVQRVELQAVLDDRGQAVNLLAHIGTAWSHKNPQSLPVDDHDRPNSFAKAEIRPIELAVRSRTVQPFGKLIAHRSCTPVTHCGATSTSSWSFCLAILAQRFFQYRKALKLNSFLAQ